MVGLMTYYSWVYLFILEQDLCIVVILKSNTVERHYNKDIGTINITLFYQGKNKKSWDQQNYLVTRWLCYI